MGGVTLSVVPSGCRQALVVVRPLVVLPRLRGPPRWPPLLAGGFGVASAGGVVLRRLLSAGEVVGWGAIQPGWDGKRHIPPGWSSEWQMLQVKGFLDSPALFWAVTNLVLLIMAIHSRSTGELVVGGAMYTFHAGSPLPSPVPMSSFLTRSRRRMVVDAAR